MSEMNDLAKHLKRAVAYIPVSKSSLFHQVKVKDDFIQVRHALGFISQRLQFIGALVATQCDFETAVPLMKPSTQPVQLTAPRSPSAICDSLSAKYTCPLMVKVQSTSGKVKEAVKVSIARMDLKFVVAMQTREE